MLTDIVGYSALTQRDEQLALRLLEEHRALVRPHFTSYGGREVKTMGDAFLVEFSSTLDAVQCSIEIQRTLEDRNRKRNSPPIELRIGIHVGDVVHRGDDVFGDAVNIVARIEPLSDPGGICISGPVFEQVRNKVGVTFSALDPTPLKNIDSAIQIYRMELPWRRPARIGATPFIGREAEIERLHRSADEAAKGHGRIVLISGEAGIGKSRLIQEASEKAERLGFRALRSHSLPGELGAPYSPWVELAREFLRDAPPQLLYRVSGTYGAEIVKLVPEFSERVGPVPPSQSSNADEARIRFLDGVTNLFQNIAHEFPLLLVLDDLHWADAASLRLLQFVARKLNGHRVLILGAFRDSDSEDNPVLVDVLTDLNRERLVDLLPLKELEKDQVQRILRSVTGIEHPPSELVQAVFQKTGGNPFFVEELLRTLSEEGRLGEIVTLDESFPVSDLRLPETVRRLLHRRLSRVDDQTIMILQIGAIAGYDFSYELLRQVSDLDEEALSAGVERALRSRIIKERRVSPNRVVYSFRDRQIRDVLYDEQSVIRRRKYHLKIAEGLEAKTDPQSTTHAHELAYHFLQANDFAKALRYSLLAADRASRVYAREDADFHYRLALEILDDQPNDLMRASILEKLSDNEMLTGEVDASLRHIDESTALFEKLGDKIGVARGHLKAGKLHQSAYYDDRTAIEHFEQAGRALEGIPENVELGRVYLRLADIRDRGRPAAESRAQIEKVLELAVRLGDSSLSIDAQFALLWSTPINQADSIPRQLAVLEGAVLSGEPNPYYIRSYFSSIGWSALLLEEDVPKALSAFQRGVARLKEIGAESAAVDLNGQDLAQAYVVIGDLESAVRLAEETYEFAIRNYPTPDLPNLVALAEIARLKGDLEKSQALLERAYILSGRSQSAIVRLAPAITLARLHLNQGRAQDALRVARDALSPFLSSHLSAPVIAASDYAELLATALEAAAVEGSEADTLPLRDELRGVATELPRRSILGFQLLAEGLWVAYQGATARAIPLLEESVEAWEQLGWMPELGRTLGHLGRVLRDAGDGARSKTALDRAVDTFRRMGATGEMNRLIQVSAEGLSKERRRSERPAEASP
jgi:tetratricopeptide (TPR) repeat protein